MSVKPSNTTTTGKMDSNGVLVIDSGTSMVNSGDTVACLVLNSSTSASNSGSNTVSFGSSVVPTFINSHTMASSGCNSGCSTTSHGGIINSTTPVEGQSGAPSDLKCRQNSVGRDIAAEFDSLFSPEVIFEFEKDSSFTSDSPMTATAATATNSVNTATASIGCSITATNGVPITACAVTPLSTHANPTRHTAIQTEHPLPHSAESRTPDKGTFAPGLFGGVSRGRPTPSESADITQQQDGRGEMSEWDGETEDEEGLKRAMEESMKDQVNSE